MFLPNAKNPLGNPEIPEPAIIIASDLHMLIMPKVAIKAFTLSLFTTKPFMSPTITVIEIPIIAEIKMGIFVKFFKKYAVTAPPKARFAPIDKSKTPPTIKNIMPIASTPEVERFKSIAPQF